MTYNDTEAMVDVLRRPSSRAVTEEEKQMAVAGPMFKIKKEKEERARLKAQKEEAERLEKEKL
jgi:hypothetical protein